MSTLHITGITEDRELFTWLDAVDVKLKEYFRLAKQGSEDEVRAAQIDVQQDIEYALQWKGFATRPTDIRKARLLHNALVAAARALRASVSRINRRTKTQTKRKAKTETIQMTPDAFKQFVKAMKSVDRVSNTPITTNSQLTRAVTNIREDVIADQALANIGELIKAGMTSDGLKQHAHDLKIKEENALFNSLHEPAESILDAFQPNEDGSVEL